MIYTALALALVAGSASLQTPADGSGAAILEQAAAALGAVTDVRYDGRVEINSPAGDVVVTGDVILSKFGHASGRNLTGKFVVTGQIFKAKYSSIETFDVAFDGTTVRRYLSGTDVVLQADAGYGGGGLLRGSFGALLLMHFLSSEPLQGSRMSPQISVTGTQDINGRPTDVVRVELERSNATVTWFIDREDHLPRQRVREFLSASGKPVKSTLTLTNLRTGIEVDPETFKLTPPEGVRVEQMGRRPPDPFVVGDLAPEWTLKDGDGVEHSLVDYRGKLVVLDFWASWCPNCRNAMPALQKMHDDYADRGVALFSINCRERGRVDPVKYLRDRGFSYPVLVNGGKMAPPYRIEGIPAFFVIGPDGRLLYRSSGYAPGSEQKIIAFIEQYLAEQG